MLSVCRSLLFSFTLRTLCLSCCPSLLLCFSLRLSRTFRSSPSVIIITLLSRSRSSQGGFGRPARPGPIRVRARAAGPRRLAAGRRLRPAARDAVPREPRPGAVSHGAVGWARRARVRRAAAAALGRRPPGQIAVGHPVDPGGAAARPDRWPATVGGPGPGRALGQGRGLPPELAVWAVEGRGHGCAGRRPPCP